LNVTKEGDTYITGLDGWWNSSLTVTAAISGSSTAAVDAKAILGSLTAGLKTSFVADMVNYIH
jgi:hypothetical protein